VDTVNAVAPHSATAAELMTLLTERWLGRLAACHPRVPIPEAALRLSGPISSLFLDSQRVSPTKLAERSFPFPYPTVEEAVRAT
jgi:NAD dependent epimerase/dehydratase family enzyme